jgi:hypothetical protein
LLAGSAAWKSTEETALKDWLKSYLNWLLTNPIAREAGEVEQNHGTAYDVQVVRLALLLDQSDLARQVLETAKRKRIARQIEPDGRQPLELGRTKSFSYSHLNLGHLVTLASFGEQVGVDLWNFKTPDGRSIRQALDFMLPYVKDPSKKWPYEQIIPIHRAEWASLYRAAANAYRDPVYEHVAESFAETRGDRFQLLHPFSPGDAAPSRSVR